MGLCVGFRFSGIKENDGWDGRNVLGLIILCLIRSLRSGAKAASFGVSRHLNVEACDDQRGYQCQRVIADETVFNQRAPSTTDVCSVFCLH